MMSDAERLMITKSIMYKIISLGCSVYVDDGNEFIVNVLICDKCRHLWNKSRTECFYCGTENYHVFTCTKCEAMYSITNPKQKCTTVNCNGKLVKMCINPECPSNKMPKLKKYLIKRGGVFQKGKSGSLYNEMRCKVCGNKSSVFVSKQVVVVDDFSDDMNDVEKIYIKKNSETNFDTVINGEANHFNSIDSIIEKAFSLKHHEELENK